MKQIIFIACLCIFHFNAIAHNGYLAGTIRDAATKEPLMSSSIYIREISLGTVADVFGNFKVTLKPGVYTVEISYVGYKTQAIPITIVEHQTHTLNIMLEVGTLQLSDLVITSEPVAQRTNYLSTFDIKLQPVTTSQDVLRLIPGLFIAQHAGGGKAEQIFLRGFDIDHGTDINLTVDGMPVNMVSHAHGQGYSDLHFVIPETIRNIDFGKGPHSINHGDFATAGFAAFHTKNSLAKNSVKLEGGMFGHLRNVNLITLYHETKDVSTQNLYIATEAYRSDGFFELRQDFQRLNGLLKYHRQVYDRSQVTISASAFHSSWGSSGQIPERAINQGLITRFGYIDDIEGGETGRYNLNFNMTNKAGSGILKQQAYMSRYDFDLISNFTFFLNDPVNGDRIRQRESRNIVGYEINFDREKKLHHFDLLSTYGAGVRHDRVDDTSLERIADLENTLSYASLGDIRQTNLFALTSHTVRFADKFNVSASLRLDNIHFQYQDRLNGVQTNASGVVLSPKFSADYSITTLTKIFVKAGYGYHSNDARFVTRRYVGNSLPKARGIDMGADWKPSPKIFINTTVWLLNLDQELVYVGDEGIVEPSGETKRKGLDISARYQLAEKVFADVDFNGTIARYKKPEGDAKYIPLAPALTSTGGLRYDGNRLEASLRYRFLGDRPANEDFSLTASGYFLMDATFSYTLKNVTFTGSIANILDSSWKEAQFETESRLKAEASPVTEIHFTPGTPRMLKVGVEVAF
jgi:CarboxypepD_reg-like domain/TonB-dependent Receptor Plug Domain